MGNFYKFILVVLLGANFLYAGNGFSQTHLVNTSPSPNSDNVAANTTLVFTFDSTIVKHSIKSNTVTLKQRKPTKKKIKGNLVVANNVVTFMPSTLLDKGIYKVKIKSIKLQKEEDKPQIKTSWQKFIAWLCGLFYDDIANCPLCQYVCNVQNNIKTKPIHYQFEVKEDAPTVTELVANTTRIELSEHNSTQLQITAKYDDNSSEDVTQKVKYTSSDSSVVDAENGNVASNQEGSATLSVSYGGKTISIQVEVYELIEGHLLPHEPQDPDATLLGVDENNNSVRDEVERWIYKDMPTYHHPEIERVIAMTKAKAYHMVLVDPTNKDDKVYKAIRRTLDCWSYYSDSKTLPFDGAIEKFGNKLRDKQFNTRERLKTYLDYDYTLSSKLTPLTPLRLLNTSYCDQNIDILP